MKMFIQIYTQVLIQIQHCDVTGLLSFLRHEKRLTITEYNSHKVSKVIAGSYFVLCNGTHCYVSKGYRAYTCRMGKKLQNTSVYLLNYTASRTELQ